MRQRDETEAYREARDSLREQGYCMVCGVYHRVGNCTAVENARREARAAALEEAAQRCDARYKRYNNPVAEALAAEIRALSAAPPQSEGGE